MRTLLFFDLPTLTSAERRNYRKFVKLIKQNGFYMLQESVYAKMSINQQVVDSTIAKIKGSLPPNGNVIVLTITEKQFNNMEVLLGDIVSDVVSTDERIVVL